MRVVNEMQTSEQIVALLDAGPTEPLLIRVQGKDAAVIYSMEAYERIRDLELKEFQRLRHELSEEAKSNGFTEDLLKEILAEAKAERTR